MIFRALPSKVTPSPANTLMLSGVIAAFHLGKVAPALPTLQATLGLTMTQAGFLLSLMQFAGALAGVIMGLCSDRIGARMSIIIGQTLLCLASTLAIVVHNPHSLLALRMLESCGFLMVVLPTPGLVRTQVPHEQIAFRLGLWGCYVAIGTAMAFTLGPIAIESIGWRGWWLIPAAGSLFSVILLTCLVPPDRLHRSPSANRKADNSQWSQRLKDVLSARGPWFIGIAFAMYSGQWMAIIGFLPTIYIDAGMAKSTAGPLTALAALVNILGNIAAAFLIHRRVNKKHVLSVGYLFIMTMTVIAFSQVTHALPELRYVAILLFSAVGGVIPATLFILAVECAPNDMATATSVGWVQQLSSLGMLLMPPMLARLAGVAGGWHWTWLATGAAAIIGLLLSSIAASDRSRSTLQTNMKP